MGEIIEFRLRQAPGVDDAETVHLHPVWGDSMEPTARPGEVWIFRAQDRFTGPGVYAITDGCYPQFKRLEPVRVEAPGIVRILSDNPIYRVQEVDLAGLQILGRVCGITSYRD